MSIYDPSDQEDLSGYAEINNLDAQDGFHLLKMGDTMSDDLHMGDTLVRGLPTTYPLLYQGDEATSWAQAVGLSRDDVGNLQDPTEPSNAATKNITGRSSDFESRRHHEGRPANEHRI